jgi:hypothetical protein
MSDTRLEIVIVNRSLDAANAITAGNSTMRNVSSRIMIVQSLTGRIPTLTAPLGSPASGLRLLYARQFSNTA